MTDEPTPTPPSSDIPKRASRYPDIATLAELGMNVDADTTFGLYAPAGVNPEALA